MTLIAPCGIRAPIQKMIPDFERKTGHTVKATFGSRNGTKRQVMNGERMPNSVLALSPKGTSFGAKGG